MLRKLGEKSWKLSTKSGKMYGSDSANDDETIIGCLLASLRTVKII